VHTTVSTASGICQAVTAVCRYRGRVGTGLSVLWVAYATHRIKGLKKGGSEKEKNGQVWGDSLTCCQITHVPFFLKKDFHLVMSTLFCLRK
jgi:hypothetical protein